MTDAHRCGECRGCDCTDGRCSVVCDWDCGCPDYPPPEQQAASDG